jgi:DNA-binding CsgD family transcriptional regulator
MARLSPRDLGQALDFLRGGREGAWAGPVPSELLDRMRDLVGCDYVDYCELDRPNGRLLLMDGCARAREAAFSQPAECEQTFWRLRHEHPVCLHQDLTGDFGARKLSDFLTLSQLHRLDLYGEFLRPYGVEYELEVGLLPAPPTHTKVFIFSRHSRDFTERERLLLEVLRPHLESLYAAARDRRVLTALRNHEDSARLVVLGRSGEVDFAGSRARELLRLYFEADSERGLSEVVHVWLRQELSLTRPGLPLLVTRGEWRLIVRRLGDVLLLREEAANLTLREVEIPGLVAEGHSNAEIASRLWLSTGTVRIHPQHIYAKLGVRNRTAAVARLRRSGSYVGSAGSA